MSLNISHHGLKIITLKKILIFMKGSISPDHNIFDIKRYLLLHIQMEYCNKTLKKVINESNKLYSCEECEHFISYYILSEILIEILESVDYSHKYNIIHGDFYFDIISFRILTFRFIYSHYCTVYSHYSNSFLNTHTLILKLFLFNF